MTPETDLAQKVAFLKQPSSYPDTPEVVESIETHMAWVFLTPDFAYKLKKPVKLDYLDFSTIDLRRLDCDLEVELNSRLSSGVYLGVLPLSVVSDGTLSLGRQGRVVDWLVHMRRLPTDKMLDVKLLQGRITKQEVRSVGVLLARFYLTRPHVRITPNGYRRRYERNVRENSEALNDPAYRLPSGLVNELTERQTAFIHEQSELFDSRVTARRIVEGHGDLRPDHICLEEPPVIFDCLEFRRSFRIQDPADELSFLSMECERLGSSMVGASIFDAYRRQSQDFPPADLLDFYKAYRACLRAKLAVWHLDDGNVDEEKWITRAQAYLHLAETYLPASQAHST